MRSRFAPSPTGYLHIGGARTALFAWLYARKLGGQFILRIEDTDQERSSSEFVDAIIEGINWLGLDYDEGPIYQMQRMGRYKEVIEQLLAEGKAYKCYCPKERLETLREQQMQAKQKPRYDGHCRDLAEQGDAAPFVIRFKNPLEGVVTFNDLVRGPISVQNAELDDLIIQRTDGTPTYNFCVVVDDSDMNMSVVIRGDDHINNTPRQINLYTALGLEAPKFAHVPMILGADGKRLSKRHGAMSVTEYRDKGILPEALLNYLIRLGWSHGDQEIFSKQEMIELFNLENVNRAPAAYNEEKLLWLNQHYLQNENPDYIASQLRPFLQARNVSTDNGPNLVKVVEALRARSKTLVEMADKATCFYQAGAEYDAKAASKFLTADILPVLEYFHAQLAEMVDWTEEKLHPVVQETLEKFSLKMPKLAQPLRIALTGNTQSPSLDLTLDLMGQARVLKDLERCIVWLKALDSAHSVP
jgi:glutamyl-tRNA synthetase